MNRDTDNEIIHRWRGGQSMRSIAREMNVSRWRVTHVIGQHRAAQLPEDQGLRYLRRDGPRRGKRLNTRRIRHLRRQVR